MILDGLFFINEVDVFLEYGIFLAEKNQGDHANYDAFLKPSKMKEQVSVDIREQNGEKLPENLSLVFSARDITLLFGLNAQTRSDFLLQRSRFINFLKTGWLNLRLTEIDQEFRVFVKDFPAWDQIIFDENMAYGQFQVIFREPNPNF